MLRRTQWIATILLFLGNLTLVGAETIKVWHHGGSGSGERAFIEKSIKEYNETNPEVKAELVILPSGSYNDQVQAAALAGKLPDLLDFDGPNYANYVWSGFLTPLNGLVDDKIINSVLPSLISQGTYAPDGKLYSLGQFESGLALWGNKALLTKAGIRIPTTVEDAWSAAEFEEALEKLSKLPEVKHPLDMKLNYGKGEWFTYGFSPIIQSMGGDLINRTTWRSSGTLDSQASVQAMTMFQNWIKKGWVVPASGGDNKFYADKNVGLAFVGHWMWGSHSEGLGDDLVLIPMPKFGDRHVTGMGSWCWGITKSGNTKAAARLLEFLMSKKYLVGVADAVGSVPGSEAAAAALPRFAKGGELNLYVEQLKNIAVPRPAHPAYPVITSAFAEAVFNIVAGADVAKELKKAARKIDEDIEDNSGYPPFGE